MQARLQQHAASQSVRLSLPLSPSLTLELDYLYGRNDSPCLLADLLERRMMKAFFCRHGAWGRNGLSATSLICYLTVVYLKLMGAGKG